MEYEQQIYHLELTLLDPKTRKSAEDLNKLLADDFMEFGSSGKIWYKKDVITSLAIESARKFTIENFKITHLAANIILATYKVIDNTVPSLRSSIWRLNDNSWQMVFHQGTKQYR